MAAGMTRIGCVIMASGQGRRFGGNKLMATLTGKPLIDYILQATEGLFQRRVVVTRHESVRQYCLSQGAEVLFHCEPERSDTIRLGIEAMADCTHCMFCMGDQPLIKRESLEKMQRAAQTAPDKIWRFSADGVPGAPVLFPRKFFLELADLPAGEGGGYVIRNNPSEIMEVNVDVCELMDIDTPADLQRIEKILVDFD
ncbi:MAG: nucleotidyltransferase family protein [Selenomonadaceae bacterium]|nr:nucleotidyltransferase family protein [Selenomonadaceae bacterium]